MSVTIVDRDTATGGHEWERAGFARCRRCGALCCPVVVVRDGLPHAELTYRRDGLSASEPYDPTKHRCTA